MGLQRLAFLPFLSLLAVTGPALAQPASEQLRNPLAADIEIRGHVLEPVRLDPTTPRVAALELPPGFDVDVFATDLINPRMIAVAEDGTVYVTRPLVGDVLMLRDTDGDGTADQRRIVANRPLIHGIAIDGSTMYLVAVNSLFRSRIRDDGTLEPLELLLDDLPAGGQHPNRTVVVGPDDMLYVSVGSTCNACDETNPENATILRVLPDGSNRTIFATGLRNTVGFGFVPGSNDLYGMDHGIDWLGDDEQREELNWIVEGNDYGWPYVYEDRKFNPQDEPPAGISMEEWAERSTAPVALYVAHSAPMQMAFYTGTAFPEAYRGDAFVAMRGSWNRNPPSGYEILRIRFDQGRPVALEPFVTGFLQRVGDGWGHIGRLAGLAQASDGSLLISDDTNGVIYRISYTGGPANGNGAALVPTNGADSGIGPIVAVLPSTPPRSTPNELATEILGAERELTVTSSAFAAGTRIPGRYGAEGENISPPLAWERVPEGTVSFVVLMEDPDVATDPPFVHWSVYNLPADVAALDEGVPGLPRLQLPEGALQGRNDRGSVGYFGPRPPADDPAHEYHFQIFALDTTLDLLHGATRAELLDAMNGHVLAQGEVVGTFER